MLKHHLWGRGLALAGAVSLAARGGVAVGGNADRTTVPTAPSRPEVPAQIYQGELDGVEVWLKLERTPRGITGQIGGSLQNISAVATLDLPLAADGDGPPAFIPQRLQATDCTLSVADSHPKGLRAACLASMQGPAFVTDGFPELIVEDDPSAPGQQFWLRAVPRETVAALAAFGEKLRRAEPKARRACLRSARIDQALRVDERTLVAYWTWDVCGSALLAAARAGNLEPGKGLWRETAWLAVIDAAGSVVSHLAVDQRALANDTLTLKHLGRLDGLNMISVERSFEDGQPTSVRSYSRTRVYAASDRGSLVLALDPPASARTSSNCWGSDFQSDLFLVAPDAAPNELVLRTIETEHRHLSDSCADKQRTTYRGYRFNPKTAKYSVFRGSDLAERVRAQIDR